MFISISEHTSIRLTKGILIGLFLISLCLLASGSWVVKLIMVHPSPLIEGNSRFWTLLLSGYLLGSLALACLIVLYQLLDRIGKDLVFISENVQSLRLLGWIVGLVALISFFLGLTAYLPMLLVAVSSSLLTLIIRVIRNAFGKAVLLQEEADYTI